MEDDRDKNERREKLRKRLEKIEKPNPFQDQISRVNDRAEARQIREWLQELEVSR